MHKVPLPCRQQAHLFTAFLVTVLLALFQQLPPLAAHHHALCARYVLHVRHQLRAEHRVTVSESTSPSVHYIQRGRVGACRNVTAFSGDSRWWFVGSAVGFILQVSLSLGQRGLHYIILSHVQLRMLLDVLAHRLLEYVRTETQLSR